MNFIELVVSKPTAIGLDEEMLLDRIEVIGNGTLSLSTLSLFNGDELTPEQFEKIIFSKTEHPTECILTPHKIINFSGFSYYSFRIFSGTLHATDKVLLYFK